MGHQKSSSYANKAERAQSNAIVFFCTRMYHYESKYDNENITKRKIQTRGKTMHSLFSCQNGIRILFFRDVWFLSTTPSSEHGYSFTAKQKKKKKKNVILFGLLRIRLVQVLRCVYMRVF